MTPLHILVAPNSFKHCCSGAEVAEAIAEGLGDVLPDAALRLLPVADGGEGLINTLVAAHGGSVHHAKVHDPLFRLRTARFGLYKAAGRRHAVIELAEAAGSALLKPHERQSLTATSFGVGELMVAAAKAGADNIAIGLGGCIASDMGLGMAQALGFVFHDQHGRIVNPEGNEALNALSLPRIWDITPPRHSPLGTSCAISIISDSSIPLLGPGGQAQTFGPQKGLSADEIRWLDEALTHMAERLNVCFGKDVDRPFAGAGGGMGAGLLGLLQAELCPGAAFVGNALDLHNHLAWADVCVTGEGRLDASTALSKAPWHVCVEARRYGALACLIAGCIVPGTSSDFCDHVVSTSSLEEADTVAHDFAEARARLVQTARGLGTIVQRRFSHGSMQ